MALLAGLLVLAVPLVGCAEDGGDGDAATGGGDGMTATDGLEDARDEAEDWNAEAQFIGAGTLETDEQDPDDWASEAPEFQADETIGDGLAHQWSYTFKDAEDNRINVYVTDEGETYQEEAQQEDAFMDAAIDDWTIQSTDAVDAAREEVGDFDAVLDADDTEIGYILVSGENEGDTGWLLDAQSESNDEQVTVTVDGETGEVQRFGQQG